MKTGAVYYRLRVLRTSLLCSSLLCVPRLGPTRFHLGPRPEPLPQLVYLLELAAKYPLKLVLPSLTTALGSVYVWMRVAYLPMYLALLSLVTMASEELDNYYQDESSLVLLPLSTKVSIELASSWAVLSHVDKPETWSFFSAWLGS